MMPPMDPGMMPPQGMAPAQGPVDPMMVQQILQNKPLLDALMQEIVKQSQMQQGGGAGGQPPMPPM